jgi:hypothetical protein
VARAADIHQMMDLLRLSLPRSGDFLVVSTPDTGAANKVVDVAKAQCASEIEPDLLLDDSRWKPVSTVANPLAKRPPA